MEFTLSDFLSLLKKTWWIIVIAAVVAAGAAYAYSAITAATSYSSKVVVMVDHKSSNVNDNWSVQDDLDYSKSIIRNCITILQQNKFYKAVGESVFEDRGLRYSESMIAGSTSYATDSDTSTFTVTVTTGDAAISYNIAVAVENVIVAKGYIANNYPNFSDQNTKLSAINEVVRTAWSDSNSNFLTYMTVGAMGAAVAAFVVLFIIDRADTRIKDDKLLTNKYGYPVLGTVPGDNKKKQTAEVENNA